MISNERRRDIAIFIVCGPDIEITYGCVNFQCLGLPACACGKVAAEFRTVYRDRYGNRFQSQADACEAAGRAAQGRFIFWMGDQLSRTRA